LLRDLTVLIASRTPVASAMVTLPLVAVITIMFHHPALISKITEFLVNVLANERPVQ
jgi:hypothetical protein